MRDRRTFPAVGFRDDRRAVSVNVGYVLTLAISAIILSALLVAAAGAVDGQKRTVVRDQLDVVGNRLAADIAGADRLGATARADIDATVDETPTDPSEAGTATVAIRIDLPRRIAGTSYVIEIDDAASGDPTLVLRVTDPDVVVSVPLRLRTEIEPVRVAGGPVVVEYEYVYDSSDARLEVRSA